jgi:uncharacterized protein (DUF488 family)
MIETDPALVIYTIGHSNHAIDTFNALASGAGITAIADVRSVPYSRRNPQFNRETLAAALKTAGMAYVWLGDVLGARPKDPALRRPDGGADYGLIAAEEAFAGGLDRLVYGAARHRVALMCAERDPLDCHRTVLVARNLAARGIGLRHVLADGRVVPHRAIEERVLAAAFPDGGGLFAEDTARMLDQAYDALAARMTGARR